MAHHATLQWTQGLQMAAQAENSPVLVMDTPESGDGPSPMDMVLMGVAGCTAMDVISILKKKRSPVTDLWVEVTGERAEEHPKGYTQIQITFIIFGDNIRPADVERSIDLSVNRYCAAIATVNARIDHSYRIEPAASAPRPLIVQNPNGR